MIGKPKCVRCHREMNILEDYANDAEDYKEELLAEGIPRLEMATGNMANAKARAANKGDS